MNKLQTIPWYDNKPQIELITRTVAKGASKDELALFLNIAKRCGLDPFTRQIHFVKRKVWDNDAKTYQEVGTVQTGIDGYRAIAERSGALAGIDDALFDTEDNAHPNKASVTVYRMVSGQRVPFTASARWTEYCAIHPKTKVPMGQWAKMGYLMLGKCAESLALRKAFPNDLSDLYTDVETQQMENVPQEAEVVETKADKKIQAEKLLEENNLEPIIEITDDEISNEIIKIDKQNKQNKQVK